MWEEKKLVNPALSCTYIQFTPLSTLTGWSWVRIPHAPATWLTRGPEFDSLPFIFFWHPIWYLRKLYFNFWVHAALQEISSSFWWCNRHRKNGTLDFTSFNHRLKRQEKVIYSPITTLQWILSNFPKETVRRDYLIVHLFLTPALARPFQNDLECVF